MAMPVAAILALWAGSSPALTLGNTGVYIYENLEGKHSSASTCAVALVAHMRNHATGIVSFDRVPLQSNESVRILDQLTKDRKIIVTNISTWFGGGVVAAPTVTLADDALKFADLTWHIDRDAVLRDAADKRLAQVIVGVAEGLIKQSERPAGSSGSRLVSVTIEVNIQLLQVGTGMALWANTYTAVQAGFDPRAAFALGLQELGKTIAADIQAFLGSTR